MNIALIGYGRMGKEIERLASDRKISVVAKLGSQSQFPTAAVLDTIDVAIHFATAQTVLNHVGEWARKKKNLVIGTTGWQSDLAKVQAIVEKEQIGLLYASNFSVGVNVFNLIVRTAGAGFDKFPEYDVAVHETHHRDKPDSPSGTALTLAKILLKAFNRKKEILGGTPDGKVRPEQLQVSSTRIGSVIGTHRVVFDSDADQIELIHTAKNRSGFAHGALLAAQWVRGKKGFFTMDDMLADVLK